MATVPHTVQPLDFTHDGLVLSAAQLHQFEEDGFVIVKNLIPQSKLDTYRQRFIDICDGIVPKNRMTIMRDVQLAKSQKRGEEVTYKVQDFTDDEVLFDFCHLPQVTAVIGDLIGTDNLMAMHTMLINKPPDLGSQTSRHPLHQDLHYFPFRPANRIVCAWTAMELVNRDNGCLVVVPGSHKGELRPHGYPDWEGGVNKMFHGIQGYTPDPSKAVHCVMNAGDTVFFHPLLIHGSGANKTNRFRKAISCHYANGAACDYIDIRGTSQENIAEEVNQLIKKKFGPDVDDIEFADTWRLRAKPVRNGRGNL